MPDGEEGTARKYLSIEPDAVTSWELVYLSNHSGGQEKI